MAAVPGRQVLYWALVAVLLLCAGSACAEATNAGGVLILHVEDRYELGSYRMCGSLSLEYREQAVTRLPGDGQPYLVGCYAAFPPGHPGHVRALSFGIRHTQNVRVISLGPCNEGGMIIPSQEWPASGGGVSLPFPAHMTKAGELASIYWFAVLSDGEGFLELTPHPVYRLGGTFVDAEMPPREESITGYGRIGFDQDGYLPMPGESHLRGACCTPEGCWIRTELECRHYEGVFLGVGAGCGSEPCGDFALKGGCCLQEGCEEHTWMNCILLGGHFLGEGVLCDSVPCPDPEELTPEEM